jgi:sugar/nucleoside kinase (ribokinase family)
MSEFDVLCIGNAIVDIIARAEDDFLHENEIIKGAMNLIDADRAELLYDRMGPAVETSGGSAGNTAAGIASLGGRAAFFGKVNADDHLGGIYRHDIRAQGVAFDTHPLIGTPPTARSMIFVTPDGERSMNTYLGACVELGPDDIEEDKVAGSGHLLRGLSVGSAARQGRHPQGRRDRPCQRPRDVDDAFRPVLRRSLSRRIPRPDAFRHGRHRLFQRGGGKVALPDRRFRDSARSLPRRLPCRHRHPFGKGLNRHERHETASVSAFEIDNLVDTTGAGDLYAAGFLYGYTKGYSLENCAHLGSLAAAVVIQQIGPRPQISLRQAAIDAGLIKG